MCRKSSGSNLTATAETEDQNCVLVPSRVDMSVNFHDEVPEAYGREAIIDSGAALAVGLTLVAAMAIQNAVQRIHLGSSPPTTLMTGTTTQIMIDIADLTRELPPDTKQVARNRLARMAASVFAFAFGCAAAALIYSQAGIYCFIVPPLLGVGTLTLRTGAFDVTAR